jgi:hypothetical protein
MHFIGAGGRKHLADALNNSEVFEESTAYFPRGLLPRIQCKTRQPGVIAHFVAALTIIAHFPLADAC